MKFFAILFMGSLMTLSTYGSTQSALSPVPHVDLSRFVGKWYEIATIPYFFERNCAGTNANYKALADGSIDVLNVCYDKTLSGKMRTGHGRAWVTDKVTNSKLRVSFFWPFSAAYWVIDLDPNYQYAVTANPNRQYLWILSRTPKMDEALFINLVKHAADQGFDISKLVKTIQ